MLSPACFLFHLSRTLTDVHFYAFFFSKIHHSIMTASTWCAYHSTHVTHRNQWIQATWCYTECYIVCLLAYTFRNTFSSIGNNSSFQHWQFHAMRQPYLTRLKRPCFGYAWYQQCLTRGRSIYRSFHRPLSLSFLPWGDWTLFCVHDSAVRSTSQIHLLYSSTLPLNCLASWEK